MSLAVAPFFIQVPTAPGAKPPAVLGADHLVRKREIHLPSHVIIKVYSSPLVSLIINLPAGLRLFFCVRRRKNEFYLKICINAYAPQATGTSGNRQESDFPPHAHLVRRAHKVNMKLYIGTHACGLRFQPPSHPGPLVRLRLNPPSFISDTFTIIAREPRLQKLLYYKPQSLYCK